MALTKRLSKGSPLTAAEMDGNLDFLQSTSQIIIYNNSKTQKCGLITPIHATKRK
jgi:hypothetical protein